MTMWKYTDSYWLCWFVYESVKTKADHTCKISHRLIYQMLTYFTNPWNRLWSYFSRILRIYHIKKTKNAIYEWQNYCGGLISDSDHVAFGYSWGQTPIADFAYLQFCIFTLILILMIEPSHMFVHVTTCTKLWLDSMMIIFAHRSTQGLDYERINCLWNSSQAIACHWEINWRASQNTKHYLSFLAPHGNQDGIKTHLKTNGVYSQNAVKLYPKGVIKDSYFLVIVVVIIVKHLGYHYCIKEVIVMTKIA